MICPANVNLSTIAAHKRGSVNVFVQEWLVGGNGDGERSSRSVSTWNSSSAPRVIETHPGVLGQREPDVQAFAGRLRLAGGDQQPPEDAVEDGGVRNPLRITRGPR